MPTPVLGYPSRAVPQANPEFDYHFENELARRLRRRFLWYCGLTVAISLAILLPGLITGQSPVQAGFDSPAVQPPPAARLINYATSGISLLVYAAAFAYVVTRRVRREPLLRLALWVYVLASIPGLIGMRLVLQMAFPPGIADRIVDQELGRRGPATRASAADAAAGPAAPAAAAADAFSSGFRAGYTSAAARANATQPAGAATQPRTMTPAQSQRLRGFLQVVTHPGFVFCATVPFVMLFHHTFACLFIPWTLRQSLAPPTIMLLLMAAIVAVDVFGGGVPWWAWLGAIPLTAVMFIPGSAWCWYRFTRIRRDITLNYESDRFRALQSDLSSARRILETALPPRRFAGAGAPADDPDAGPVRLAYLHEPMRQIGGDLLFVHPPADRQPAPRALSLVLLDVTGHGIAAALSVNRLVGELERLFGETPDAGPADVLAALNRYVYFTMARHDMYVTAVALRVDADAGTLAYASAGQPTAYLRRASGQIVDLPSTTILLGVVDAACFAAEPATLPFAPGDAVVAYTDGANEAMNDDTGEMLGMSGVRRAVADAADAGAPPHDWPDAVMRCVVAHRNAPPADDTMVVTVYRV